MPIRRSVQQAERRSRTSAEMRDRVQELRAKLDPVHLLKEIRALQQPLVRIADRPAFGETAKPTSESSRFIIRVCGSTGMILGGKSASKGFPGRLSILINLTKAEPSARGRS